MRRLVLISIPVFAPQRRAALRTETAIAEDGSALLAEWRSTMGACPPGQSLEQAARIVAEKQRAGSRAGWAMAAMRDYDPLPRLPLIRASTTIVRPKDSLWDDGANAAKLNPWRLVDRRAAVGLPAVRRRACRGRGHRAHGARLSRPAAACARARPQR
ncbi:MAG: hypothetical protein U1F11_05710 [Steroidobacteraceae bacterium]